MSHLTRFSFTLFASPASGKPKRIDAKEAHIADGSTWSTMATYVSEFQPSSTHFVNGYFRYGYVLLNESSFGSFGSNTKIRFQCNGSGADDDVFIDQVKISARVK